MSFFILEGFSSNLNLNLHKQQLIDDDLLTEWVIYWAILH